MGAEFRFHRERKKDFRERSELGSGAQFPKRGKRGDLSVPAALGETGEHEYDSRVGRRDLRA